MSTTEISSTTSFCRRVIHLYERSKARPHACYVFKCDISVDACVQCCKNIFNIVTCALWIIHRTFVISVGGADICELVGAVATRDPGDYEQTALVAWHGNNYCNVIANLFPGHGEVNTLCRTNGVWVRRFVKGTNIIGPNTCCVDNCFGADSEMSVADYVMDTNGVLRAID